MLCQFLCFCFDAYSLTLEAQFKSLALLIYFAAFLCINWERERGESITVACMCGWGGSEEEKSVCKLYVACLTFWLFGWVEEEDSLTDYGFLCKCTHLLLILVPFDLVWGEEGTCHITKYLDEVTTATYPGREEGETLIHTPIRRTFGGS